MKLSKSALLCCLIALVSIGSTASAQQSPWAFQYADINTQLNVFVMPPFDYMTASATDVTFTSPDGTATGTGTPGSGSSASEYFNSYSAVQADAAGKWSLSAVRDGVTSTYNFSADLSSIPASSIPTVDSVDVPPYGTPYPTQQPTFQWTESGEFNENFVDVHGLTSNVHYQADLPVDQTSWTVPASLPAGSYEFILQLPSNTYTVPLSSTLLSGPDLDLPTTASFGSEAWYQATFFIVPEPTSAALTCTAGLAVLVRRRRKTDVHDSGSRMVIANQEV